MDCRLISSASPALRATPDFGVVARLACSASSSLRWRRFFFRAWIVLSAVWVIAIFAAEWEEIVEPIPAPPAECGHPGEMACVTKDDALVATLAPPELRPAPLSVELERAEDVAVIAFLPPAGVLVLGLACAWVLRGLNGSARS